MSSLEKPDCSSDKKVLPDNALEIFCRFRPSSAENAQDQETPCILKQKSDTVLSLRKGPNSFTEQLFTFEHIFDVDCTQQQLFQRIAKPKVDALLAGESNGLIFAYGSTGSGKSFTVGGRPKKAGLVPNIIVSLFDQLKSQMTTPDVCITPDGLNHYTISIRNSSSSLTSYDVEEDEDNKEIKKWWSSSTTNSSVVPSAPSKIPSTQKRRYAVFISFVEIYNNYIYDLLPQQEQPIKNAFDVRRRAPLLLRLDGRSANGTMYAHGAQEVYAKTATQAMRLFLTGLHNRQTAATALNSTSSRSHSVFTIKLVSYDEEVMATSVREMGSSIKMLTVKQLSVVDLAGVERSKRSNVSGAALAETSNINNSLLTLRNCFQAMRLNQEQPRSSVLVPYRNHKLTYLLKSFFEGGQSSISMIICLKPSSSVADIEENVQVLAFCKNAQEVHIVREQQQEKSTADEEKSNVENQWSNLAKDENEHLLSSVVDHITLTRFQESNKDQEMTTISHFWTFAKQVEQYLDVHEKEATHLETTIQRILTHLSEKLKHCSPERQAHRQTLHLIEGEAYSYLKMSANIIAQLLSSGGKSDCRGSCSRLSCFLPPIDTIAGTPIILRRFRGAVSGEGDATQISNQMYQSNDRLLKELARELQHCEAANVDSKVKLQSVRADLGAYIIFTMLGGQSALKQNTQRSDGGGKQNESPDLSKMDVFNRLYLQTPARYKVVHTGNVSKMRALFTPPSSTLHQKKTGNYSKRCLGNLNASSKVRSMCKQINERNISSSALASSPFKMANRLLNRGK